jgi:hypothetical protein
LTRSHDLAKLPDVPGEPDGRRSPSKWPRLAADAVANFLTERGAHGVLTDDVADGARVRLEAHLPRGRGRHGRRRARAIPGDLARIDATWTAGPVGTAPVPAVDWESVFRAHHTPIAVGTRLLVAPPWDVPPAAGGKCS